MGKEIEPKPIQCWEITSGKCEGIVKPYGYVEKPSMKILDLCEYHYSLWGEAFRPFVDHLEIQKRLLDQEGL